MYKLDRSGNSSSKYQYKFNETNCGNDTLAFLAEELGYHEGIKSVGHQLAKEKLNKLRRELIYHTHRIAREVGTDQQWQTYRALYILGLTQQETAKLLNLNQSSITKNMVGNTIYNKNGTKLKRGGLLRKMKEAITEDEQIQEILAKIQNVANEDPSEFEPPKNEPEPKEKNIILHTNLGIIGHTIKED